MGRYLVTVEKYIFAENDEAAVNICKREEKQENTRFDNGFKVLSLHEAPQGQLTTRKIW